MAEIIELQAGAPVPADKWYQMYGPPFTGDPINSVMFSFKEKFGYYPETIIVAEHDTYFAQHKSKPTRKEEHEEEI